MGLIQVLDVWTPLARSRGADPGQGGRELGWTHPPVPETISFGHDHTACAYRMCPSTLKCCQLFPNQSLLQN